MKTSFKRLLALAVFIGGFCFAGLAQGVLSGNMQVDAQIYQRDSLIGAPDVSQKFRSNSFVYLQYTYKKISVGTRVEGYLDPIIGYDSRYQGVSLPYLFGRYSGDIVDVTIGSFYEQFGSGMILRSYQDWNLGLDNSLNGARVIVSPTAGITIKGLIGTQRYFKEHLGQVRGVDIDLAFNDFIKPMASWGTRITLGGSFVSKYEKSEDLFVLGGNDGTTTYKLNVPQNVGSFAGRLNIENGGFSLGGEYVWKAQDPSAENGFIYKNGQALLVNLGYSTKGFSMLLSAKSVDNMGYRARRTELGNYGMINYLPALSRQHLYTLPSFYPYACQPNGETGFQADFMYKVKKGTALGGKYGMDIKLNASMATSLKKEALEETPFGEAGTNGYQSKLFAVGKDIYYTDINLELSRRFGKKVKASLMYMYQVYNQEIVEAHTGPSIRSHIIVGDVTYLFNSIHALRAEVQYMAVQKNQGATVRDGNWVMATLEYTIAPKWFVTVSDLWNHGNADPGRRLHYYNVSAAFVHDATRIALSYGRNRQGIICAGGVCRELPASNGLMLTVTTSF